GGKTLAVRGDGEGGRVFILRGGKLVNTLTTAADDLAVSPDGKTVAVTKGNRLEWYSAAGGLVWGFTADDILRHPRISPDGKRVCVGSELGTLSVLDTNGEILARRDLGALPAPAWLPDGGLVAATWMGLVVGYDKRIEERWRTRPKPTVADIRATLL